MSKKQRSDVVYTAFTLTNETFKFLLEQIREEKLVSFIKNIRSFYGASGIEDSKSLASPKSEISNTVGVAVSFYYLRRFLYNHNLPIEYKREVVKYTKEFIEPWGEIYIDPDFTSEFYMFLLSEFEFTDTLYKFCRNYDLFSDVVQWIIHNNYEPITDDLIIDIQPMERWRELMVLFFIKNSYKMEDIEYVLTNVSSGEYKWKINAVILKDIFCSKIETYICE